MTLSAVFLLVNAGCATTNLPNLGVGPYVAQDDEKRLMNRAQESIEAIDHSGLIYEDKSLEDYLNKIAARVLNGQVLPDSIHIDVKVVKDPLLNAFSFPNGRIYVDTGVLAASENESQIATLLAHEITHILHRHVLKEFRSLQNTTSWWESFGILTGGIGLIVSELAKVSTISGYSQEMENEADENAFQLLMHAGYDIKESVKFFESLQQYDLDEENKRPYFFSSHPHLKDRIKNFSRLVQSSQQEHLTPDIEDYGKMNSEIIFYNLQSCLRVGMYKTAEHQLKNLLSTRPEDAKVWQINGDLYRERQDVSKGKKEREKDNDYISAIESYDHALKIDPDLSRALWGKARVLYVQGKKDQAKAYFQQYLAKEPDAKDKAYILHLIQ